MKKADIINEALELAQQTAISSESQQSAHIETSFKLIYEDILKKRNWLFAHDIKRSLTATTDGASLGYKFKYRVSSDILKILDINRTAFNIDFTRLRSRGEALRFGYEPPDSPIPTFGSSSTDKKFILINGILHSDEAVTSMLVQKDVAAEDLPVEVKELLIYTLAIRYGRKFRIKAEVLADLKEEALSAWVNATRAENQVPANQHLRGVYEWLTEYYSQTVYNRNFET